MSTWKSLLPLFSLKELLIFEFVVKSHKIRFWLMLRSEPNLLVTLSGEILQISQNNALRVAIGCVLHERTRILSVRKDADVSSQLSHSNPRSTILRRYENSTSADNLGSISFQLLNFQLLWLLLKFLLLLYQKQNKQINFW